MSEEKPCLLSSPEAELLVLGAALRSPEWADELDPDIFALREHRDLLQALRGLRPDAYRTPTGVAIGELPTCVVAAMGGVNRLQALRDAPVPIALTRHVLAWLRELAFRRRIMRMLEEAARRVYDPKIPVGGILAWLYNLADELGRSWDGNGAQGGR